MKYIDSKCVNGVFMYIYQKEDGSFINGPKPSRQMMSKKPENASIKPQSSEPIPTLGVDKKDSGKARMDLVRPEFTKAIGEVLAYGAEKYQEPRGQLPNYLKQNFEYSRLIASLERHIGEWKSGIDLDDETGKNHLAHAAANLMMLYTLSLTKNPKDDRILLDDL